MRNYYTYIYIICVVILYLLSMDFVEACFAMRPRLLLEQMDEQQVEGSLAMGFAEKVEPQFVTKT